MVLRAIEGGGVVGSQKPLKGFQGRVKIFQFQVRFKSVPFRGILGVH